ncbi:LMBR1-domain-containing protein [Lichtheimia hyalospora FSU 10163]|nr:LMBR1-domain-containing protein [Lichtheimia hyalospora FSU 10163]
MDSDWPPPTEPSPISPGSNYAPLVLGTLALFVIAVTTVSRYGNLRSHPWYVSTVCIIGWCFPFWIVLLLPVDLASSTYDQCQGDCRVPFSHVSQSFLYVAWRTLYWTSFCLTWVMIPMMQAYVNTGDFGFTNRLKSAVRVNLQFYSIYIVIGFIGLIYLVFGSGYTTREKIQGFVMAMANSWGLFLVIMFMGYGLVAVPRRLWFTGNPQKHLNQLYANASRVKEECMDSELEFIDVCKIMHAISKRTTRADPFLRGCVDQMTQRFPFILDPEYTDRDNSVSLPRDITEDYLIKLNRRMILAARMKDRKLALWENLLSEAFYLQDITENRNNTDHQFHSTLRPLRESTRWNDIKAQLEWWWLLRIEPIFHRGVALLCAVLSVCILWSEIVFNIKNPVVSIVALGLRACGYNYAAVEFMAFFTLMFMCICVYTSLFKVRFFNLYILIPKHHTDENSLLWFTSYMCKMMAPLCYNYINLAGDFSGTSESVFNKFMGGADLVPFLGTTFIDWFPVVILIPALSVLFNFQGRCLGLCGVKDPYDDEEAAGERESDGAISLNVDIADGKVLVIEERGVRERTINPHLADQRGFLSRARNALGAYTSKYNRGPYNYSSNSSRSLHTLGGGNAEGRTPLSATLRQERDRRIDEILSGRTTPTSFTNNRSNQYSQEDDDDGLQGYHSQQDNGTVGGFLSFGDAVKNKFNDLFIKKSPGGPGAVSLSPESDNDHIARQQDPLLRPDNQQGRRGRRVFGQPPSSSSSSSSPKQSRRDIARSRSPSPPPTGLGLSSAAGPQRTDSPFANFDSKGRDMNNIFNDL